VRAATRPPQGRVVAASVKKPSINHIKALLQVEACGIVVTTVANPERGYGHAWSAPAAG